MLRIVRDWGNVPLASPNDRGDQAGGGGQPLSKTSATARSPTRFIDTVSHREGGSSPNSIACRKKSLTGCMFLSSALDRSRW